MIFALTHLNVVFFTRVCECLGKLGLTNWCVQPFFLFQKWHHLSSGWPETRHNSTTWLNYFRRVSLPIKRVLKQQDIQMLKHSSPAPLQQLPVTPVHVLSASVTGGCVAQEREPGFSAGILSQSWQPHVPWAAFLVQQSALCKQTNLCLNEEKDRDFLNFISTWWS